MAANKKQDNTEHIEEIESESDGLRYLDKQIVYSIDKLHNYEYRHATSPSSWQQDGSTTGEAEEGDVQSQKAAVSMWVETTWYCDYYNVLLT